MNFDLSEDQELFKAAAERFVAPVDTEKRRAMRRRDGAYDRTRWNELAELGLIALAAPQELGGLGGSLTDLAVVAEALGHGNALDPWLENGVLPALLLSAAGDEARLSSVIDGARLFAFAFAERAQRYDLKAKTVQAEAADGGYRLTGEKTFVTGAPLAEALIVTAAIDGATGFFVVPRDALGLDARTYELVDGSLAAEIVLRDVRVAEDARLAISPARFDEVVGKVRLLAAAEMTGLAQRLLEDTLDYVKQREQFGVAIGSFQALQHRLVERYAAVEQSRSMLWRAVLADTRDAARWAAQAAGAKAYIAENALETGREAVQMHGGMGVTDELAIGHAFKRVLLLERLFGGRTENLFHFAEAA